MATESTKAKRWKNRDTFTTGRPLKGMGRSLYRRNDSKNRDQRSGIRDQGSEIRDQGSEIRDQGAEIRGQASPPSSRLLLAEVVVHVDDVGLEVLFQTVLAVSAADAGLAPAGVEALHGLEVLAIHVGLAELQLVRGAHGYIERAGVDGGGQAVLAVVGVGDGFVEGGKRGDGQDRTKGLPLHDGSLLAAIGENRGLEVVAG